MTDEILTDPSKRIGILTSGGDCPGLNAVIYAVVKYARTVKNWRVYGIPNGTDGFVDIANGICQPEDLELHEHSFDIPGQKGINVLLFLSGSVLGCRGKKVPKPGEAAKILAGYRQIGLDALIAIGGDGSLEIIADLAQQGGWNLVAVPKTIDNDIPLTDRVVGFDTAVDTVAATLHNLSFTAASHDHVMIVEVMGRDGGHLALHAGIAGGADVILIPELIPYLTEKVVANICDRIAQIYRQRRKFALIVVAEGIDLDPLAEPCSKSAIGADLKQQIEQYVDHHSDPQQSDFCRLQADLEVRVSVLGRIQRSSPPTTLDRLLAVSFGVKAVDAIAQSQSPSQQMVVWKGGQTQIEPLARVIEKIRAEKAARQAAKFPACAAPVDPQGFMVHTARSLGIYVGD
ncbi:ATP-dependent 6-phosphofructokinase [Chamaesiphon sp. OTE_75_metabat_556]|uniref:ATP-dependent 6-phosphofructokinase n=1 Tax=Chamaesiphon sp. OTE_75_metabat_556 TaxID=2964692 RepID=UPI00286B4FB3|nr:ATP-dependent 6-phosphofructokinase [Chamaesiphon sp. OTE_75_metabat_556]